MRPLIELKDLSYSRNKRNILQNVNFKIEEGERIVVLGENGSGKTTFLNVLVGDIFPDKGECIRTIDQKRMGVVYDKFSMLLMLKVKEIIHLFCVAYSVDYKLFIYDYYDIFKLSSIMENYILNLSMGERRRVSILLSLVHNPSLIILDEPFSSVDPTIIDDLLKAIYGKNRAVVYTTHDWSSDSVKDSHVYMMYEGLMKRSKYSLLELILLVSSQVKVICGRLDWDVADSTFMFYIKDENVNILGNAELIVQKLGKREYRIEKINMQDLYYINNKY